MLFILMMAKQSSASHDPSEITLICRFVAKQVLSILKTAVPLNIFAETVMHFYYDYLMNRKF